MNLDEDLPPVLVDTRQLAGEQSNLEEPDRVKVPITIVTGRCFRAFILHLMIEY
jgi:hypothetical protein